MCAQIKYYVLAALLASVCLSGKSENSTFPTTCDPDKYLKPRVVDDLEVIYGSHGVPIEYWYNETSSKENDLLGSVPGCPMSIDGFPWVYYGDPPKCFLAGHNGPCPEGEKLFAHRGSLYGKCVCKCLMWVSPHDIKDIEQRYMFCGYAFPKPNLQIYDKQAVMCYGMYEQGPCQPGTVVVSYNKTALGCYRICDHDESLKILSGEMKDDDSCHMDPSYYGTTRGGCGASGTSVSPNECVSADERFSEKLKRCVKIQLKERLVVG